MSRLSFVETTSFELRGLNAAVTTVADGRAVSTACTFIGPVLQQAKPDRLYPGSPRQKKASAAASVSSQLAQHRWNLQRFGPSRHRSDGTRAIAAPQ
eukprot:tig00021073_g18026.t1